MKRLIAVLLALMLPFQLSWAAVGEYCQHESSPQMTRHFGHHAHVHQDADQKAEPGKKPGGKSAIDSDCGFCHAGTPATMAARAPRVADSGMHAGPIPLVLPVHSSAPARVPDRPQWARLA